MMDLVMVRWVDTVFEDTCQHIVEAVKWAPVPRVNVGYLLRDGKDKVVLCFGLIEKDGEGPWCDGIMAIPKGMVTEIKRLEIKE